MSELVARTGRHQQRYEDGYRLVAGYITITALSHCLDSLFFCFWIFSFSFFFWWLLSRVDKMSFSTGIMRMHKSTFFFYNIFCIYISKNWLIGVVLVDDLLLLLFNLCLEMMIG